MKLLQVPATITKITTMSNRVLRITCDTQENLKDEQMQKIMSKVEKFGHFCFLEDTRIKEEDVVDLPPLPKDEGDKKTPSQRLHSRMFVYYVNTHKDKDGFNAWYIDTLDKLGQQYLNKLEPIPEE